MRGVITAPERVITGAWTLLFSFPSEIDLTETDIKIETLEGHALGHAKDKFGGSGKHYHLLCYLPDAKAGKSRVSVAKPGVTVEPVIIEYDTVRTVIATWGTPVQRNRNIDIPVTFDASIKRLRKQHFRVSEPKCPCQLYGRDNAYELVVSPSRAVTRFQITISGTIEKTNGLEAVIEASPLEVEV